jgi:hypothetical protein
MNLKLIKNIKDLDKIIDCKVILQLDNHNSSMSNLYHKFALINKIV